MTSATLDSELTDPFYLEYDKGGRAWLSRAWSVLRQAGVVPVTVTEESGNYVDHFVTLAATAHVANLVFAQHDGDLAPYVLVGDRPLLTEIELGRVAEQMGVYAESWPEEVVDLSRAVIEARARPVARSLAGELGHSLLFAELWAQRLPDASYPLSHDVLDDILNSPTPDSAAAFEGLGVYLAS